MAGATVISRRGLNRALLERQHLLRRRTASAANEIEYLVGMQAQIPNSPYVGLWSRLEGFEPKALSDLLLKRRAVRLGLLRNTIHLVTADDCLQLRPLLQPVLVRGFEGSSFARQLQGVDRAAVMRAGQALLEEAPMTLTRLGTELQRRWPGSDATSLAYVIRHMVPVVQIPPRGVWGKTAQPMLATAETWLGRTMKPAISPGTLVRRYLRAFGPATPSDATNWSAIPGMREVFERMRPRLRTFRDERGRELFDVPDGALPDADTPAPPRFLPEYDNVLLGHEDRTRVIAREHRYVISSGTFLLDGFAAGTWAVRREPSGSVLSLRPFSALRRPDRDDLEAEGARLHEFLAKDAVKRVLRFEAPGYRSTPVR